MQNLERSYVKHSLWIGQNHLIHELRTAMAVCTKPEQEQAGSQFRKEEKGAYKFPHLKEKPVAADGFPEKFASL